MFVVVFVFVVAPVEDSNNKSMHSSFRFVSKLTDNVDSVGVKKQCAL